MDKYLPPKNKPKAFIFDVDGTLAKMSDRSPYEWHRVGEDALNVPVYLVYKALKEAGYKIIIFTGRDGVCKRETLEWLKKHEIHFDVLEIRKPHNTEKDHVIKKRMLDKIGGDYEILGVFDDRDQVVKMWRAMGLTCFQVDYGNFVLSPSLPDS